MAQKLLKRQKEGLNKKRLQEKVKHKTDLPLVITEEVSFYLLVIFYFTFLSQPLFEHTVSSVPFVCPFLPFFLAFFLPVLPGGAAITPQTAGQSIRG